MPFRGRDFDTGNNEEIVDRLAVFAHQSLVDQIGDCFARVVIRDGEPVQPFLARGRDVLLGTRNSVAGKERVSVEVDLEGHVLDANLERRK